MEEIRLYAEVKVGYNNHNDIELLETETKARNLGIYLNAKIETSKFYKNKMRVTRLQSSTRMPNWRIEVDIVQNCFEKECSCQDFWVIVNSTLYTQHTLSHLMRYETKVIGCMCIITSIA